MKRLRHILACTSVVSGCDQDVSHSPVKRRFSSAHDMLRWILVFDISKSTGESRICTNVYVREKGSKFLDNYDLRAETADVAGDMRRPCSEVTPRFDKLAEPGN